MSRGGEVLWTFVVVRPSASSGTSGSGVELRQVAYRGKEVLRRAHVPILNVRYKNDACGPFRDWQNEESHFKATGANVAPGFKLCPSRAETILESGQDQGNFRGVAIYVDGEEVVVVSELEAGWYRYISRWRLHADGSIKPRFGFGAVRDSCVCNVHFHHAYWRFDFDIAGAGHNEVGEFNDPPLSGSDKWHTPGPRDPAQARPGQEAPLAGAQHTERRELLADPGGGRRKGRLPSGWATSGRYGTVPGRSTTASPSVSATPGRASTSSSTASRSPTPTWCSGTRATSPTTCTSTRWATSWGRCSRPHDW